MLPEPQAARSKDDRVRVIVRAIRAGNVEVLDGGILSDLPFQPTDAEMMLAFAYCYERERANAS